MKNFIPHMVFYNHMSGLMSYLKDVDFERWEKLNKKFAEIQKPFEEVP